jgi:hypothetical protein
MYPSSLFELPPPLLALAGQAAGTKEEVGRKSGFRYQISAVSF